MEEQKPKQNKWIFRIVIVIIAMFIIPWIANFSSNEYSEDSEYTEAYLSRTGMYMLLGLFLIIRWAYIKFKPKDFKLDSNVFYINHLSPFP